MARTKVRRHKRKTKSGITTVKEHQRQTKGKKRTTLSENEDELLSLIAEFEEDMGEEGYYVYEDLDVWFDPPYAEAIRKLVNRKLLKRTGKKENYTFYITKTGRNYLKQKGE